VHAAVYKSASVWQMKCTEMLISDEQIAFCDCKCFVHQSGKLKKRKKEESMLHMCINELTSVIDVYVSEIER